MGVTCPVLLWPKPANASLRTRGSGRHFKPVLALSSGRRTLVTPENVGKAAMWIALSLLSAGGLTVVATSLVVFGHRKLDETLATFGCCLGMIE